MKILITVDPEIPVPPINYGGIERIVDSLITAYNAHGHEVYLLANPKSTSKNAEKIIGWKGGASRGFKNVLFNAVQLQQIVKDIKPDAIHSFSRLMYLYPTLLSTNLPVLMTYQREISVKSTALACIVGGRKIQFTSCGAHMLNHLKAYRTKFNPVHNFAPVDYFIPDDSIDKEYLMFLGRIENIKGTKEAIEVALATNNKLIIAGNIQHGHDDYFNTYIKPHLNNPLIEYVGPVNDEQKRYYLQRSKAFLFPIKWEEPFGIVMAEAMACGVPVIGFNRGSVSEVVKEGVTGFIVNDVPSMIDAVHEIDKIDRNEVRIDCIERFSLEVIAKQYLDLLQNLPR